MPLFYRIFLGYRVGDVTFVPANCGNIYWNNKPLKLGIYEEKSTFTGFVAGLGSDGGTGL